MSERLEERWLEIVASLKQEKQRYDEELIDPPIGDQGQKGPTGDTGPKGTCQMTCRSCLTSA